MRAAYKPCIWRRAFAEALEKFKELRKAGLSQIFIKDGIHGERTASEPQDRGSSVAHSIEVPSVIIRKWQEIVDLLAEVMHVPSASIMRVDPPHMARHFLEWQRLEKWGKRRKRHVPHNAGVLVIGGDETKKPEYDTIASVKARRWKSFSRKFRQAKTQLPREFSNYTIGSATSANCQE